MKRTSGTLAEGLRRLTLSPAATATDNPPYTSVKEIELAGSGT